MSRFEGPRGLIGYAQFDTEHGDHIELQESSSVMAIIRGVDVPGPFVWLRLTGRARDDSGHLSVRDATELRDALNEFLAEQPEWEYTYKAPNGCDHDYAGMPTFDLEEALEVARRFPHEGDVLKRRTATPWVPVKQEGQVEG